MHIKKSQQFLYFQNKARHYDNLAKIKSTIDDQIPKTYRSGHTSLQKKMHFIPPLQQHSIKIQNQHLINRIVNTIASSKTQIQRQGYARFYKIDRPFRRLNPYSNQTQKQISISNQSLQSRIRNIKPAIGSTGKWQRQYEKTSSLKRNISRYLDTNQSKVELQLSNQKFIPNHLRYYALRDDLEASMSGKQIKIPFDKLFELPQIKSNSRVLRFPNRSQSEMQESQKKWS